MGRNNKGKRIKNIKRNILSNVALNRLGFAEELLGII